MEEFGIVLSSGVVAGLVAGFVTLRTTERKIAIENITQQRQIWRDKVRDKAKSVTETFDNKNISQLSILTTEFSHLLNPLEDEDNKIINLISGFKSGDFSTDKHSEFVKRIALLLKHDWERAKHEAKPWFFRCNESKRTLYPAD
ncbi:MULTISPECIES: hypothetical protein [Aeromonas]|uniref:hypothetical protein n=1 Tax=Aeromonas TaxID=642 RepID=UPI0013A5531D|nr:MULTISPECIES: hypothetical protein [Aeromonas]